MFKVQIEAQDFLQKYSIVGRTAEKSVPWANRMTQIIVLGNLDISNRHIFLPDNLKIYGNFIMHRSWTSSIGNNTEITGNCDIRYTGIKSLPEQFIVHGDFSLVGTEVSVWPEDALIEGNVYINDAKLKCLPDNFFAFRDLKLSNLDMRKLPSGMRVNGDLDVRGIPLDRWPDDIAVRGNVKASRRLMENFPVQNDSVIPRTSIMDTDMERKQNPSDNENTDNTFGDIIFI